MCVLTLHLPQWMLFIFNCKEQKYINNSGFLSASYLLTQSNNVKGFKNFLRTQIYSTLLTVVSVLSDSYIALCTFFWVYLIKYLLNSMKYDRIRLYKDHDFQIDCPKSPLACLSICSRSLQISWYSFLFLCESFCRQTTSALIFTFSVGWFSFRLFSLCLFSIFLSQRFLFLFF